MKLVEENIALIKNYLSTQPVLRAYLFGSFADGLANEQSDIDLLVDLDYSQHIGLGFVQMKLDLEAQLHRKVDLVSSNGLSKHIAPYINKQKILIYER